MHEIDDERPIPLGRAAATSPPSTEAAKAAAPASHIPAAPTPGRQPAAHIERTRPAAQQDESGAPPTAATIAVTPASRALAVIEPSAPPPPGPVVLPQQPASPDAHPLAALRGLRMEVTLVEPVFVGRDLGRFFALYFLVIASVFGLIVAFLALLTHAR